VPPVATKLTQSPWFLNKPPQFCQPPFLHWSLLVGSGGMRFADSFKSNVVSPAGTT
jgi:hypothetical protein